jgi:hypothetical protein
MNHGTTSNITPISNFNVTSKRGNICHNNIVTDYAIVGYVGSCHKQCIITDNSFAISNRSSIDSYKLSNDYIVAYDGFGFLAVIFKILRNFSDRVIVVDLAVIANGCS